MAPYIRPYVSPKQRAENRARWIRFGYRAAVAILAMIVLMMFGYSDQAPHWLREVTISLDAIFGFPVLWLIKAVAA